MRAAAQYVFRDDKARLERYPSMYVLRSKPRSGGAADDEPTTGTDQGPVGPTPEVDEHSSATTDQPADDVEALAPDA